MPHFDRSRHAGAGRTTKMESDASIWLVFAVATVSGTLPAGHGQQVLDRAVGLDRMPKLHFGMKLVAIAPPLADASDGPRFFQVGHDGLNRALGDPDTFCQISQACIRLLSKTDQHVCVIRQKGPARVDGVLGGHALMLPQGSSEGTVWALIPESSFRNAGKG